MSVASDTAAPGSPDSPGQSTGAPGSDAADAVAVFGRVITAMVTPFDSYGRLDESGIEELAGWLTREGWNDSVVVNGTTGESIATDDAEKVRTIIAAKRALAGTGRQVIAGVGAASTQHSVELAEAAAEAGADALMVVAPYYARPSQAGLLQHFRTVASVTGLPVMLYDIPQRTGVAIEAETLASAAEHPRIMAVKDATGDLDAASWIMRDTGLAFYSGEDALNLPWLSVGATGVVSVAGHVVGDRLRRLLELHDDGRNAEAIALHRDLLPLYRGMLRAPGAASAKGALQALGLPAGPVRLPLVSLTAEQHRAIQADVAATVTELGSRPAEPAAVEQVLVAE